MLLLLCPAGLAAVIVTPGLLVEGLGNVGGEEGGM